MCTYNIGQSERYAEHGLIWESGVTVYYILLYILAPFLPFSQYIVFGLIALESVVKIIAYSKIIREKKWLDRIEEHLKEEDMMLDYEEEYEVKEILEEKIEDAIEEIKEDSAVEEEIPLEIEVEEPVAPLDIVMVEKEKKPKAKKKTKKVKESTTAKTRARFSR